MSMANTFLRGSAFLQGSHIILVFWEKTKQMTKQILLCFMYLFLNIQLNDTAAIQHVHVEEQSSLLLQMHEAAAREVFKTSN